MNCYYINENKKNIQCKVVHWGLENGTKAIVSLKGENIFRIVEIKDLRKKDISMM